MHLEVVKSHETSYPNPISFEVGESLTVGIRDNKYKGWVWVTTSSGNEGWAPEQYIDLDADPAIATKDYSANELNTKVGEILEFVHALNSWVWVKNSNDELGWVPYETIQDI